MYGYTGHRLVFRVESSHTRNLLLPRLPTPFSPGCSNWNYEVGTKDPRLLSQLLQPGLKGYPLNPKSLVSYIFLVTPPMQHMLLYMRSLPFELTHSEPFNPGWSRQPVLKGYPLVRICGSNWD